MDEGRKRRGDYEECKGIYNMQRLWLHCLFRVVGEVHVVKFVIVSRRFTKINIPSCWISSQTHHPGVSVLPIGAGSPG